MTRSVHPQNKLIGQRRQILIFGDETVDEVNDAIELTGIPVKDLIDACEKGELVSPITLWLEIINNPTIYSLKERMTAAKDLSQYSHKKMPVVTEEHIITEDKNFTIDFIGDE